jgi:hypothetical protein
MATLQRIHCNTKNAISFILVCGHGVSTALTATLCGHSASSALTATLCGHGVSTALTATLSKVTRRSERQIVCATPEKAETCNCVRQALLS